MAAPLRIGIFGGGTVGGGVYELLKNASSKITIEKICVRSLSKPRDFAAAADLFTTEPSDILDNASIDCVVEVMGGTGLAKTVVLEALKKGKSVVTANKALLAEYLDELRQVAMDAQKPLLFEAAVCGGIPIINLLQTAYTGDVISKIQGICNGTTNFMLTKMAQEGADYHAVLKEAQDLGFAEADPTADVEGHDVRAKLALLAKLAYGTTIVPTTMACVGISQLTAADFAWGKVVQPCCTIKLLGTTTSDGTTVGIYVLPALVPMASHSLATISGSGNAVAITSQNMGSCLYTGPGAGRFPTANSVVADLWRIQKGTYDNPKNCDPFPVQTSLSVTSDFASIFYLRISLSPSSSGDAATAAVTSAVQEQGVNLDQSLVADSTLSSAAEGSLAWTTKECSYQQIRAVLETLKQKNDCISAAIALPILPSPRE